MAISERTIGELIRVAADLSHREISVLLKRSGIGVGDPGTEPKRPGGQGPNKETRLIEAFERAVRDDDDDGLLTFCQNYLDLGKGRAPDDPAIQDLLSRLRGDGYATYTNAVERGGNDGYKWTIGPLGATEIPLPIAVGTLQNELDQRGLTEAGNHFSQAYRAYKADDLEAANSQLRPTFESVLVAIARQLKPGWRENKGGSAINVIDGTNGFRPGEHDWVRGLWQVSHPDGSHPGTADPIQSEARFYAVASLLRYLIRRFL